MAKLITAIVISQIEVPDEAYEGMSNKEIQQVEKTNWQEWFLDNVETEKIIISNI